MKKSRKVTGVIALILTISMLLSVGALGATEGIVVGHNGDYWQVNLEELEDSYFEWRGNPASAGAALFAWYYGILTTGGKALAYLDDVGGYVSIEKVEDYYFELTGPDRAAQLLAFMEDLTADNKWGGKTVILVDANGTPGDEIIVGNDGQPADPTAPVTVLKAEIKDSTEIFVTFSGDIADDSVYVEKANYSVSAPGSIVSVEKSGSNSVKIKVDGFTYGSIFVLTVVEPDFTKALEILELAERYTIEFVTDTENNSREIVANGERTMMITASIFDHQEQEYVTEAGQMTFSATAGSLGQSIVTMQNGEASVQLTSSKSTETIECVVTATVSSALDDGKFLGLVGQETVFFTKDEKPTGGGGGEVKMVSATGVGANQADRFYVHFSDDLIVTEANKAAIMNAVRYVPAGSIGVDYPIAIKNVYNFGSNDTIMFVLDTENGAPNTQILDENYNRAIATKNYLRDNATHGIRFNMAPNVISESTRTLEFILTDVSTPWGVDVTFRTDRELEIRFSEPMAEDLMLATVVRDGYNVSERITIEGDSLLLMNKGDVTEADLAYARANNYIIVTRLDVGTHLTRLNDTRNIVYIEIYKDQKLLPGIREVQVSNVGDWAGMVDVRQNRIETQTLKGPVVADTVAPTVTVDDQSPEQWLIEFSRAVESSTGIALKDSIVITSQPLAPMFLPLETFVQGTNVTNGDYVMTGYTRNAFGTLVPIAGGYLNPNAVLPAEVDAILVEFNLDWSVRLSGYAGNSARDNYWKSEISPFILKFTGLESPTGVKLTPVDVPLPIGLDEDSPFIEAAVDGGTNGAQVFVTMSEPVQIVDVNGTARTLPITASLTQDPAAANPVRFSNATGIQKPVYRFINDNDTDDVREGSVLRIDEDDTHFVIVPDRPLGVGSWTLYIESISDDHGNTSATTSHPVIVTGIEPPQPGEVEPYIVWAAFDAASAQTPNNYDYIYIKYSLEMLTGGEAKSVNLNPNYSFMAQALPTGSSIQKGIKGETTEWDGITIRMPAGTWTSENNSFTTVLQVASNFVPAAAGRANDQLWRFGPNRVELTHVPTWDNSADANGLANPTLFEAYYHNQARDSLRPNVVNGGGAAGVTATANGAEGLLPNTKYVVKVSEKYIPIVLAPGARAIGGTPGYLSGTYYNTLAEAMLHAKSGATYISGFVAGYTYVFFGEPVIETIPVTGVTLDKTTLALEIDEEAATMPTATLVATVTPADATNKDVKWSSDKVTVATVSPTGVVTAVGPGTATITVKTADGGFTATCAVTVTEKTTEPDPGDDDEEYTIDAVVLNPTLRGVQFVFTVTSEREVESVTFYGFDKVPDANGKIFFVLAYSLFESEDEYTAIVADKATQKAFIEENLTLNYKGEATEDATILVSANANGKTGWVTLVVTLDDTKDLTGAVVTATGTYGAVTLVADSGARYINPGIADFPADEAKITVRVELPAENSYYETLVDVVH